MEETNKTLALLLVAAIVVSLGGTIVSLNKLGQIQLGALTGRATDTSPGYVQLNVTSETTITFTRATINFGNGYVNSTCNNCTMNTNSTTSGTNYTNTQCCINEWKNPGSDKEADTGLWIQNQGNTNLTLNLDFDKTAATFIGGSSPSPEFQWIVINDSSARSCTGTCSAPGDDTGGACAFLNNYGLLWNNANMSDPEICASYGFKAITTQDEFVIDVRVLVPRTAIAAQKTATLTVTGTSA